jgi:uncharacterized membrane protein YdjX (TVP38/TMEM64 family)
VEWLRNFGAWGWLAGIALLMTDLVLPIPSTVVMSALGFVYGPLVGGALAAAGSWLAGMLAYGLCRLLGPGVARRLVGEKDLARGQAVFARIGGWLVAWSRWLPVLQETIACMAGLTRMPFGAFALALACGCLPMGFAFAAIGHAGVANPALAITLSAALPPILWLVSRRLWRQAAQDPRVRGDAGAS